MTQKKFFKNFWTNCQKHPPSVVMVYERTEGGDFYAYQSKQAAGGGAGPVPDSGDRPAASAAALPQSAPGSQDITPYFLYIKGQDCILDISGRTAYINAWVSGQTSVATKCKIRAELQEKASAYAWTLVDSWTDQQNGDWAEVDETASVTPGKTYRVKVTVTVWAGSQSESKTFYSNEVEA